MSVVPPQPAPTLLLAEERQRVGSYSTGDTFALGGCCVEVLELAGTDDRGRRLWRVRLRPIGAVTA